MSSNPEDIMAEYLLNGGKMLDKTCPSCGSPLFIMKGDTICVVCSEARKNEKAEAHTVIENQEKTVPDDHKDIEYADENQELSGDLRDEMEKTIIHLCRRARQESRSEDCLAIIECIKIASDVLKGK